MRIDTLRKPLKYQRPSQLKNRVIAKLDKTAKLKLYEQSGVKEYWLVDPDREEIEVLTLKRGSYESIGIFGIEHSFESGLLKGLWVRLKEIF